LAKRYERLAAWISKHGVFSEEFRDLDRDGRFDVAIKYDRFQNPIETNSLRLLSAPSP